MAKADFGILGGFRGALGTVIGTRYRRRYLMRSLPRRKPKRKKVKVLPQHRNLSCMSSFMRRSKEYIKIGFQTPNPKLDPRSLAMKYNMKHALMQGAEGPEINFSKVKISRGSRERAWSEDIVFLEGAQLAVSWDVPSMLDMKLIGQDIVYIVLYDIEEQVMVSARQPLYRSDLGYTGRIGTDRIGHTIHGWIFFVSPDGKEVSDSDYLGSGTVLT